MHNLPHSEHYLISKGLVTKYLAHFLCKHHVCICMTMTKKDLFVCRWKYSVKIQTACLNVEIWCKGFCKQQHAVWCWDCAIDLYPYREDSLSILQCFKDALPVLNRPSWHTTCWHLMCDFNSVRRGSYRVWHRDFETVNSTMQPVCHAYEQVPRIFCNLNSIKSSTV